MTAVAAVLEQRKTSDQNDSSALFVRKNDTKRESPALLWEEGGFWSPPTLHLEIGPRRTQNKPISARGKEHAWPSWQEVRSGNTSRSGRQLLAELVHLERRFVLACGEEDRAPG